MKLHCPGSPTAACWGEVRLRVVGLGLGFRYGAPAITTVNFKLAVYEVALPWLTNPQFTR